MEWSRKQEEARLNEIKCTLNECKLKSASESRTPSNVSCSGVLRGVLTRQGDVVCVQGRAEIHGKRQEFHSEPKRIMQSSSLMVGIDRAIYELEIGRPNEASAFLNSAVHLTEIPPAELRFPHRFNDLTHGLCCEVFICEKFNIVSNSHAYQDDAQQKFRATDTVSAKSVDPTLMFVAEKLGEVCATLNKNVTNTK